MKSSGAAISIDELNGVLSSLKTQREIISETYNSMVKKVLENSSSCFAISGLDFTTIQSTFDSTFKAIDANFDSLITVLESDVIKNYLELISTIRRMFGQEFASKMSELLGV